MSNVLMISLVCLGCLVGVLLTAVRLPGTWLIVGGSALMGWLTNWKLIGVTLVLWIAGLAVLAEILEAVMSAMIARRAGGSHRAAWGALLGGFAGLIFLSFPLPVIGSVIGALLGCFFGAVIGELSVRGSLTHGTRVGVFATVGSALGTALKVAIAFVISILVVASVAKTDRSLAVQAVGAPALF